MSEVIQFTKGKPLVVPKVPLNTKRVYTIATCRSGCQVYFPVDSTNDEEILKKKVEFQRFLDSQVAVSGFPPLVA